MNLYNNLCTLILACLIMAYYFNNQSDGIHIYQLISSKSESQSAFPLEDNNANNIEQHTVKEEKVIATESSDNTTDDDTTTALRYTAKDKAGIRDNTISPLEIFTIREDDIVLGNKDSNVKIFEYFSYTCYHCAEFHTNYFKKLKEKFINTGKVAYIKREFVTNKPDFYGTVLSRCGGPLMWEKFNDILLQQQDNWIYSNGKYIDILTSIGDICGLSSEQFNRCLEDEKFSQIIFQNNKLIKEYTGFEGTPCIVVVVDDKQVINISNLSKLAIIIEKSVANSLHRGE